MTVRELIARLSDLNPDAPVLTPDPDWGNYVEPITYDELLPVSRDQASSFGFREVEPEEAEFFALVLY